MIPCPWTRRKGERDRPRAFAAMRWILLFVVVGTFLMPSAGALYAHGSAPPRAVFASGAVHPVSSPPAPFVTVGPDGPGAVLVQWSPFTGPGFGVYQVSMGVDGAPIHVIANITNASETSWAVENLSLDSHLSLAVTVIAAAGSNTSAPVPYTVPLVPPLLTVTPDPALPGQAWLNWTLPPVDHFEEFLLRVLAPGGGYPVSYVLSTNGSIRSALSPVVTDLATVEFAVEVQLMSGGNATSPWVPFTPSWEPPDLQVSGSGTNVTLSWSPIVLPDLSSVVACWTYLGGNTPHCTGPLPLNRSSAVLILPSVGTYSFQVVAHGANGFVLASPPVLRTLTASPASPAVPWYQFVVGPAPVWLWLTLLTLAALLVLMAGLYVRERSSDPRRQGMPVPWDPAPPSASPEGKAHPHPEKGGRGRKGPSAGSRWLRRRTKPGPEEETSAVASHRKGENRSVPPGRGAPAPWESEEEEDLPRLHRIPLRSLEGKEDEDPDAPHPLPRSVTGPPHRGDPERSGLLHPNGTRRDAPGGEEASAPEEDEEEPHRRPRREDAPPDEEDPTL